MKGRLVTWSDEVVSLQSTVTSLQKQVVTLKDRRENMEGRMRWGNIRITAIDERPDSSSLTAVSKVIREALQMDRDIKMDRLHRIATPRTTGDREKLRVVIAKLHHDRDATEILRKARERAPLIYNANRIAIFPDYTSARVAFTDVRKMLRGRRGVRYGQLYPARLCVSYKDEDKEFLDPMKAMEFIQMKVIPFAEPQV